MIREDILDKDKIDLIKNIYKKALLDINKIKKNRDEGISKILKDVDSRHINKILENIKNIK